MRRGRVAGPSCQSAAEAISKYILVDNHLILFAAQHSGATPAKDHRRGHPRARVRGCGLMKRRAMVLAIEVWSDHIADRAAIDPGCTMMAGSRTP